MVKWNTYAAYVTLIVIYKIFVSASHDIEVSLNDSVSIGCSPPVPMGIQWHHTGHMKRREFVYAGKKFYSPYKGRFQIDNYSLLIPSVNSDDAGLYVCSEETSVRQLNSVHLTVLESSPVCGSNMKSHGYVGPSTCNLEQEEMTFTCAVSYNGKPPEMIWTALNDSQAFNVSICKTENGRINCSLILKADPKYDGSIFTCKSTRTSANCSTDVIRIQYFENHLHPVEKNISEKVNCSVKSNQILQFKWAKLQGNEYVTVVKNQTLLIRSPGSYRCIVEYRIRNVKCSAYGSEVFALNPSISHSETGQTGTTAIIVLLIIVVICVAGIIITVVLYRHQIKKLKRRRRNSNERTSMLSTATEQYMNMPYVQAIKKNMKILQRCTDVNFRVIDCLAAEHVLTIGQGNHIRCVNVPGERIDLLFRWLKKNQDTDKFDSFLSVMEMEDVAQQHVANLLRGITEGESAPMSEARYTRLESIRHSLATIIKGMKEDIGLLYSLHLVKAISQADLEKIETEKPGYDKSSMLVGAIMRRNNNAYDLFRQELIGTKLDVAAKFLEEGEMINVHAETTRSDMDGALSDKLNELIKVNGELLDPLNGINLPPAVAQPGKSIEVLIYCREVENVTHFEEIFNSGELEEIICAILNKLLLLIEPDNTDGLKVKLIVDETEAFTTETITGIDEIKGNQENSVVKHREFLVKHLDCDNGLLDELHGTDNLSYTELLQIKAINNENDKNGFLLECILTNNSTESFIEALEKTAQQHLVNYLLSDGEYETSFGDEWPLTDQQIRDLDLQHLEADSNLFQFYCERVINIRQLNLINSMNEPSVKNEVFQNILRKSSLSKFNKTLECLQKINQHTAKPLLKQKRSAEPRSQTKMEILPMEMLDMILLKTVRRMMVINSSEAFKSFDELMYQVLNHLRTISLLWDNRFHATEWVKIQLRRLRNTSKERDQETKRRILDCYAIFVKDVDILAVRVSLFKFKVVKTEKLNDIFNKSSNNESLCRAFLDHLFIEGHPLAFLAMKQVLDENKADILDHMYGRKTCTMTEKGSVFLSNEEIKGIVSRGYIYLQLMAEMDPDRLGDWLKQERFITIKEWQENIAPLVNIKARRRSILGYLSTISHTRAYIILRQLLIQDNPKIASAIDNETSEAEKKYDIRNQIAKHREFLMERMDSEFDLLRTLRTNSNLTNQEFEEIEAENTHRRRNGRLLDCVLNNSSKDSADLFIEALIETDQGHLVNYLISDGVYESKVADDWPLTEADILSIDSNYEVIICLLDTNGLLKMLCAAGVINSKQRDFISSKPTSFERNEGFLELLRKTSLRNYKETIRCLHKSKQNRVATILETGDDLEIAQMTTLFDRNLVKNWNAAEDFSEWTITKDGGDGFLNESVDDFGITDCSRCWSASYGMCSKYQIINLLAEGFTINILDQEKPTIEFSEWTASRRDCGSHYFVEVTLQSASLKTLADFKWHRDTEQWQSNAWIQVLHQFRHYPPGVRFVKVVHGGKDRQFWAGHYGPKITATSVKVKQE